MISVLFVSLVLSEVGSGDLTNGYDETTCETENIGYTFAEFPCSSWRNCDYECYDRYRYPLSSCASLKENCPICCARGPEVVWWVVPLYLFLFVFILCVMVSLTVRVSTTAYSDDDGNVHLWPWFWFWFWFWPFGGFRGRGRVWLSNECLWTLIVSYSR